MCVCAREWVWMWRGEQCSALVSTWQRGAAQARLPRQTATCAHAYPRFASTPATAAAVPVHSFMTKCQAFLRKSRVTQRLMGSGLIVNASRGREPCAGWLNSAGRPAHWLARLLSLDWRAVTRTVLQPSVAPLCRLLLLRLAGPGKLGPVMPASFHAHFQALLGVLTAARSCSRASRA